MLGLGLNANKRNKGKGNIVKDGLVLNLDGRDFSNYPPTSSWRDRSGLGNNATPGGFGYIAPYAPITSDLAGTNQNVIEYYTGDGKIHYEIEGETLDIYSGGVKADFVGKMSGSVIENPNMFFRTATNDNVISLYTPSTFPLARENSGTDLQSLNGVTISSNTNVNGSIPQQLFSFDLIKTYEKRFGTIPSTTQSVADKIVWLKANVKSLVANWYGYGSCPSGYKATFVKYTTGWVSTTTNTSTSPTMLSVGASFPTDTNMIQSDGFIHYLAYTDASNGTIPSTIYTDYVSLDITLKPSYKSVGEDLGGAGVHKVDVLSRGKNLINPATHIYAPYVNGNIITIPANEPIVWRNTNIGIPVKSNTVYTISSSEFLTYGRIAIRGNSINDVDMIISPALDSTKKTCSFNTGNRTIIYLGICTDSPRTNLSAVSFTLQLEEGSTATTYVPYTQDTNSLTLAQPLRKVSSTVFDKYAEGIVNRNISNWVTLDGSLGWGYNGAGTGLKSLCIINANTVFTNPFMPSDDTSIANILATKYTSALLTNSSFSNRNSITDIITWRLNGTNNPLIITVSNADSGWVDAYTPTGAEIKAYFYGWKMCMSDGTTWDGVATKYWKKITDGSGITSTLPIATYSGYTPYKMLYQLATPTTENITVTPINGFANGSLLVDGGVVPAKTNLLTSLLSATSGSWKPLDVDMPTLGNGTKNEVVNGGVTQKVGKAIINGSENWSYFSALNQIDTITFAIINFGAKPFSNTTTNVFSPNITANTANAHYSNDAECVAVNVLGYLLIRILKSKLATQDVAGFKAWLQANPTTVYYELATPIVGSISLGGKTSVETLNGTNLSLTSNVLGSTPQIKVKFNLIDLIEKKYGTLPCASDLASKVAWVKGNVSSIACNDYIYGLGASGNKATLNTWNGIVYNNYVGNTNNSNSPFLSSQTLIQGNTPITNITDGFIHFITYTDPTNVNSSGVFTPSSIYMDYISLQVTFKTPSGSDGMGGVVFDGVDDNTIINHNSSFDVTNFTMETNICPTNVFGPRHICGIELQYKLRIRDGVFEVLLSNNIGSWQIVSFGTATVNTKVHLAFTVSGTNFKLYINGVNVYTTSIIALTSQSFTSAVFGIGNVASGYFAGNINKVRFYNRALTDTEILRNYKASR